jgi:hypothetical protein
MGIIFRILSGVRSGAVASCLRTAIKFKQLRAHPCSRVIYCSSSQSTGLLLVLCTRYGEKKKTHEALAMAVRPHHSNRLAWDLDVKVT